jgi:hypothetical protein
MKAKLFRARASHLRKLAHREDASSLSDALLRAAGEWDALADRARGNGVADAPMAAAAKSEEE